MDVALIVLGILAVSSAWRLVATGRASVWVAMGTAVGAAGVAAMATGKVGLSPEVSVPVAVLAGLGSGIALYAATRAFVWAARDWSTFRRHAEAVYGTRGNLSLPAALAVAVGVVVTGEELFWRGLVQVRLAGAPGTGWGAALAWLLYVFANVWSASLAIVAGAVVSGAVWASLAWWTGGMLASLASHAAWTGLMIVLPPVARPTRVAPG
jgi:membrane protease YdiL (CAAX protease family)